MSGEVPFGVNIPVPPQDVDMDSLGDYACRLETFVNTLPVSYQGRLEFAMEVVTELDNICSDSYYGYPVRLEGEFLLGYDDPHSYAAIGGDICKLPLIEGKSVGFIHMASDEMGDDEQTPLIHIGHLLEVDVRYLPDGLQQDCSEAIVFGRVATTSLSLLKEAQHQDVMDRLGVSLAVSSNLSMIDKAIHSAESEIDFNELSRVINLLCVMTKNPIAVEDYISYANIMSELKDKPMGISCDAYIEISQDESFCATFGKEYLTGTCLGLCFGLNRAYVAGQFVETEHPQLFLAIEPEDDPSPILVPAQNIDSYLIKAL